VDANLAHALTGYVWLVIPEAILTVAACVLFLAGPRRGNRGLAATIALVALAGALLALIFATPATPESSLPAVKYASPLLQTHLALLIKYIGVLGGAVLVLFSWHEVPPSVAGEYHGCLLLIIAGNCLTGSANDLVTLFLALELISIPTYVLLYLPRLDDHAQEAAMKYFLISIFSSALLLLGFSFLYGTAGTTNLPALTEVLGQVRDQGNALKRNQIASGIQGLPLVALVLVVAAMGFRITAVPFHFYAPDVYQGTSIPGAALLAFIPKFAGFVVLIRLLGLLPGPDDVHGVSDQMPVLLWILAAVTMSLGNVLALWQDNLRRMLAYSSVAHAGYMLIGLAVAAKGPAQVQLGGVEAVLFYLIAYGAMTVGAFAVLSYLSTPEHHVETVDDLAGLGRSHPGSAVLMVLFLFSLIGLPVTAGFWGKLFIFLGAVTFPSESNPLVQDQARLFLVLTIIGAINAAIGCYYYLRIAGVMYLRDRVEPLPPPRSRPALAAVLLCAVVTLAVGIYPWPLVKAIKRAVRGPGEPGALATGALIASRER
jgi:NADH-quinone oxidoreductase subunit N